MMRVSCEVAEYNEIQNMQYQHLLASRVDLYANWINRVKNIMEEDNKKVRYSRLSPFVMFYGNKDSKEVGGLLTFLGEKFAMTHYMDNSKLENLRVLPGIKRLVPSFDWSKGIAIADVRNYGGDTQLAIVELESEINEGQYEIKLPATLYPISGSRCEIMTILTAKTNREELTSRNNFDFSDDAQILHEVRVIPWDYRECKRYMNELKENQFCIRLDGDVQNRNHCELITAGNPVICNGQVTGIVNDPEPPCKPHKPRICTNVFQLLDWLYDDD
ncbi:snake venom serine protease homolog 2-like [Glossina fuscipes fuscipes]